MDTVRALLAGAAAGLAVDLSLYPLDTLKTRLQSTAGFRAAGGFRHLYRGLGSVALGSAPGSALFFVTYSSLHTTYTDESSAGDAARACCGEFVACLVRVPTEVVKQNAQVSTAERSVRVVARRLWRERGARSFYRGFTTTLSREIPFAFIEYPLWEFLKRRLVTKSKRKPTPMESAFCGSAAGVCAAGVTTPLDVAKTRIMLSTTPVNTYTMLTRIARSEGYAALFSGWIPRCAWMGIGGYIYFFAYEYASRSLSGLTKSSTSPPASSSLMQ